MAVRQPIIFARKVSGANASIFATIALRGRDVKYPNIPNPDAANVPEKFLVSISFSALSNGPQIQILDAPSGRVLQSMFSVPTTGLAFTVGAEECYAGDANVALGFPVLNFGFPRIAQETRGMTITVAAAGAGVVTVISISAVPD